MILKFLIIKCLINIFHLIFHLVNNCASKAPPKLFPADYPNYTVNAIDPTIITIFSNYWSNLPPTTKNPPKRLPDNENLPAGSGKNGSKFGSFLPSPTLLNSANS